MSGQVARSSKATAAATTDSQASGRHVGRSSVSVASSKGMGGSLGVAAIAALVLAGAVIADRAVIALSTGGRGVLPLAVIIAPAAAVAAVARYGTARTLAFVSHPVFLVGVLPYLVLTLGLPILGVMFHRYPERTLLSVTEATTAFAVMVLGAAASAAPLRRWAPWLFAAIGIQFLYALGQLTYLGRGPGWDLFAPLHAWDMSFQALYGTFVQSRASGLYFNPNELGAWAASGAILAWVALTGRWRLAGVTLALLTLLLSQSRGASVALVAAVAGGAALAVVRRRTTVGTAARTMVSVGLATAIAVVIVVALEPSQGLVDRFSALAAVWAEGPGADANLAGRLDYWASVIDLNSIYPWGTWGPPEMLLGSAVDSTWFRVFAQGSIVYAGALILLFASPFAARDSEFRDVLMVITVVFAVAALTQTPFNYPVSYLFWALLGAALQWSTRPVQEPDRPRTGEDGH